MTRFIAAALFAGLALGCGGSGSTGPGQGPGPNDVVIQGFAFDPTPRTIAAGTTVTWVNHDDVNHTSTGGSGQETWNSGALAKNGSFSHTFNVQGTYQYTCTIHPGMHGTIVVN
jgi:plastocyanin